MHQIAGYYIDCLHSDGIFISPLVKVTSLIRYHRLTHDLTLVTRIVSENPIAKTSFEVSAFIRSYEWRPSNCIIMLKAVRERSTTLILDLPLRSKQPQMHTNGKKRERRHTAGSQVSKEKISIVFPECFMVAISHSSK